MDPFAGDPIQRKTLWADIADPIKAVADAAVSAAGLVIEPASSYMLTTNPTLYKAFYLLVCADEAGIIQELGALGTGTGVAALAKRSAWFAAKVAQARKAVQVLATPAGAGVTVAAASYLICKTAVDPTTTTTTVPPTTTTTVPPSVSEAELLKLFLAA